MIYIIIWILQWIVNSLFKNYCDDIGITKWILVRHLSLLINDHDHTEDNDDHFSNESEVE